MPGGLLFKVPFAFLSPPEANRTVGRHQFTSAVIGDGFPLRVIAFAQIVNQIGGADHPAGNVETLLATLKHHQHRHIGVGAAVVEEIIARVIKVKRFEDHVAHRHGQRAVGTLFRRQPLVAELGYLRKVRGNRDGFGALVAHFRKEVGVRGSGLRDIGAPGDNIAGVVPVGGLGNVGLLAPGHWRGGGKVAVPVVEAQAGAAEQRQIPGAGGVRDHRHRRDRRKARHAVRAVVFDGPDVGGGDQLVQLLPA